MSPTGFTFLVPAYAGCPGKEAIEWVCSDKNTMLTKASRMLRQSKRPLHWLEGSVLQWLLFWPCDRVAV